MEIYDEFIERMNTHLKHISDKVNLKKCPICNKSLNANPCTNISPSLIGEPGLQIQFAIERHYLCEHDEIREGVDKYIIEEMNKLKTLFNL